MSPSEDLPAVATLALPIVLVAMLLSTWRLIRGPTRADRVIALDLLWLMVVGFIGVFAIAWDEPLLVDVALVVILVNFLATIALARTIDPEGRR